MAPDDRDRADVLVREPAQIMGQPDARQILTLALAGPCLAAFLVIPDLIGNLIFFFYSVILNCVSERAQETDAIG